MRKHIVVALCISMAGCSAAPIAPSPVAHFVLLQFNRSPDSSDVVAVDGIAGPVTVTLVPFAHAATLSTTLSDSAFLAIGGVDGVADLGATEQVRGVYITVIDSPTVQDLAFVKSVAGAPAYALDSVTIGTAMLPSDVEALAPDPRFTRASIESYNLMPAVRQ